MFRSSTSIIQAKTRSCRLQASDSQRSGALGTVRVDARNFICAESRPDPEAARREWIENVAASVVATAEHSRSYSQRRTRRTARQRRRRHPPLTSDAGRHLWSKVGMAATSIASVGGVWAPHPEYCMPPSMTMGLVRERSRVVNLWLQAVRRRPSAGRPGSRRLLWHLGILYAAFGGVGTPGKGL